MSTPSIPSTKPYLLRAIHEWCCDNGFTPYIAVAVDSRCRVPMEFVRDGQIVLNVGPDATHRLQMGNDFIEFQARFGGVARDLSVPLACVAAIYARENGAGMAFDVEEEMAEAAIDATGKSSADASIVPSDERPPEPPPSGRPKLQRIK